MVTEIFQNGLLVWAAFDPLAIPATYVSLTGGWTLKQRRAVLRRTIAYSGGILVCAIVLGPALIRAIGIHVASFQLAGGIILFLIALQMIFVFWPSWQRTNREPNVPPSPLTFSGAATPGAIVAVILLVDSQPLSIVALSGLMLALLLVLALSFAILVFAEQVHEATGKGGSALHTMLMGMILAAFAVEMIMTALEADSWFASGYS